MQAEQENYDKVASLPDFRLFTWFFVIPGLVLVALALTGLFVGRDERELVIPRLEPRDDIAEKANELESSMT